MNTRIHPAAFLLALAAASIARADTFTWAGADGNLSDPTFWSGAAPIPGGSAADQLVFPTSDSNRHTVTVDSPWSLNSLTVTPAAGQYPNFTIASSNSANLQFDGPSPSISAPEWYVPGITINVPVSSTSNLTALGSVTFTQLLSFSDPNSQLLCSGGNLIYQNNACPAGLSTTVLGLSTTWSEANLGCINWTYSLGSSDPATLSFGSGPLVFNSGRFALQATAPATVTSASATFTNPIIVRGSANLGADASSFAKAATFNFSGPITLGGVLFIDNAGGDSYTPTTILSGSITLDQLQVQSTVLGPSGGSTENQHVVVTGNIVDDPNPSHTAGNPLTLSGILSDASEGDFTIAGPANTYSTGTIVVQGIVNVAPNSTLGSGPVTVEWGATLRIASPSSVATGQKIHLLQDRGTLAITFDQDPQGLIAPDSGGILALDTVFTTPLDMSKLGNGTMALGTTQNGTYASDSLLPGTDHVYRFNAPIFVAPGAASLVLLHSVLKDYGGVPSQALLSYVTLAAANSYSGGSTVLGDVYAAAPGALGSGNVTIGAGPYVDPYYGRLFLSAPAAYASTANVDVYGTLAAVGANGSVPLTGTAPILHPGSAIVLGDTLTNNSDRYPDSMPVHLNYSTFVLKGFGVTDEAVGPVTVSGLSTIVMWNPPAPAPASDGNPLDTLAWLLAHAQGSPSSNPNSTTLIAQSITHDPHAVLFFVPFYLDPAIWISTSSNPTSPAGNAFLVLSPPAVTHGMVAPWMQSRDTYYDFASASEPSSFLTYGPSGLVAAAYKALPSSGGTGTEIVDLPSGSVPITLAADTSIYALRAASSILNPATGPVSLHILSGGLIGSSPSQTVPIRIEPNVDFGAAEAFVNVDGEAFGISNGDAVELAGIVTAQNGLTKFGFGTLILSNPANAIHGPITIHEGEIRFAALPDPTSTTPITLSGDAILSFYNATTLSRPVIVHYGTSIVQWGAFIQTGPGQPLAITAPITGDGPLSVYAGNNITTVGSNPGATLTITAPISITNTLSISANQTLLSANITCNSLTVLGDLRGTGTITAYGRATFASGKLSPGANPGEVAALLIDSPSTEFSSACTLDIDFDSTGHSDRLLLTGDLDIFPGNSDNDGAFLSLHFLAPPTGEIYTLLSAASITGTFSSVTGLPDGYSVDYTASSILLVPDGTAVPEPGTLGLIAFAGLMLSRRRIGHR